jgi:hypothetical protein
VSETLTSPQITTRFWLQGARSVSVHDDEAKRQLDWLAYFDLQLAYTVVKAIASRRSSSLRRTSFRA